MRRAVNLQPYDGRWAADAERERERVQGSSRALLAIHHIGSTAVAGMTAKPIIDLLGVAGTLAGLDAERAAFERIGYEWRGERGLPGRRYLIRADETGRRLVHLHCYASHDPAIGRHLAFRDYLRAHPDAAAAYAAVKIDCARRHPADAAAYAECKGNWVRSLEQIVLTRP